MHDPSTAPPVGRWRLPLLMSAVFLVGLIAGSVTSGLESLGASSSVADSPAYAIFEETWNLVQDKYVLEEEIDDTELMYGAARGMVQTLGDVGHSAFLDPVEAQSFKASLAGELIGIGVRLRFNGEYPEVIEPIRGSPAEEAGIESGDLILAIHGESTARMTFAEIGNMLRGEEGVPVELTIGRPDLDLEFDLTLERARIEVPPVQWAELPDGLFLIQLNDFSRGSAAELGEAIEEAIARSSRGIVLDMRGNPGGFVDEASRVAGEFLPEDSVLYVQRTRSEPWKEVRIQEASERAIDVPLVVLVSESSASAAEIVAASLRDNGRAQVLGVPTFGTGTVVSSFDLADGSVAAIGTAIWQTPKGEDARRVGIQPTTVVEMPAEGEEVSFEPGAVLTQSQIEEVNDAQLLAAIQSLQSSVVQQEA